jgi:DtxR family Mn-dependent transcriptional regulator
MTTRSKEDYLKNIYHISEEGGKVNTGSLATALAISPASVSEMVNKLSKEGLIDNKPYHGFELTPGGRKISLNLIRKHRLLEVFLHEHLHYEWDQVHEEAEVLEHVCSDMFINKLEEYLSYPKFDPHGDPIPDKELNIAPTHYKLLLNTEPGREYIIAKVKDSSIEILQYLTKIGIKLNSKITLSEKIDFDGSVVIIAEGKKNLLSKVMAEQIFVAG